MQCPKCKSSMTKGTRIDMIYGGTYPELWIDAKSIRFKDKKRASDLFERNPKKARKVVTYACDSCDYLESYREK